MILQVNLGPRVHHSAITGLYWTGVAHLYLVLHLFWKMFPAGSAGEVFGQFWWGRREVARHPPLGRVVPAGGRGKTTCGGVTALHLHHPPGQL